MCITRNMFRTNLFQHVEHRKNIGILIFVWMLVIFHTLSSGNITIFLHFISFFFLRIQMREFVHVKKGSHLQKKKMIFQIHILTSKKICLQTIFMPRIQFSTMRSPAKAPIFDTHRYHYSKNIFFFLNKSIRVIKINHINIRIESHPTRRACHYRGKSSICAVMTHDYFHFERKGEKIKMVCCRGSVFGAPKYIYIQHPLVWMHKSVSYV